MPPIEIETSDAASTAVAVPALLGIERLHELSILTLSRPAKANALNIALIEALHDALSEAEEDETVRGILLLGAGANFCSGADLRELMAGGPAGIRTVMNRLRTLLLRFESSRLAIVAGVHGAARAGGLELTLACDAVIATRSATFGDAHLSNSLLPAGGSSARLPRTIGWQRAKWLILSATSISSAQALDWGLIVDLCADDDLRAQGIRTASALCSNDGETFAKAKDLFGRLADSSFGTALEAEISMLEDHAGSASFSSGIRDFFSRKR